MFRYWHIYDDILLMLERYLHLQTDYNTDYNLLSRTDVHVGHTSSNVAASPHQA